MTKRMNAVGPLLALILCLACATSGDQSRWYNAMAETPMAAGVSRVYAADFDKIVQAAEDALAASGLNQTADCPPPTPTDVRPACAPRLVNKVNDRTSYIYGTKDRRGYGVTGWNGTQVRIVIERAAPSQSIVRVVSMYREETRVGGSGDYSKVILDGIERRLNPQHLNSELPVQGYGYE